MESLNLSDNPLRDVSSLAESNLRELVLGDTRVALADIAALPYFDALPKLGLGGLGIRDVSALAGLPLEDLDLDGNPLADIAPLSRLSSLRYLSLSDIWPARLADIGAILER